MNKEELFEKKFDIKFKNRALIKRALTHCSYQKSNWGNNERLEFLGDAVVDLVITEYLYENMDYDEGKMSHIKNIAVGRKIMAIISDKIDLLSYSYLGKSERTTEKKRGKVSILANMMEAVIGAIYIEFGFKRAKKFILKHWDQQLEKVLEKSEVKNQKSKLQEYVQKRGLNIPEYKVVSKKGPPHDREFKMACYIEGKKYSEAAGKSKKKAEIIAAKKAYKKIKRNFK